MRRTLVALLSGCALASVMVPKAVNAWIKTEEDLLTGKSNSNLLIDSSNTVNNSIGQPDRATIIIRCKAGKLQDIYVSTPTYNADNNRVRVRWDDGDAQRSRGWSRATSGTALFAPRPARFFKKLTTHDKLVWAWHPYQKTETAVSFDLASERDDLNKMVKLCGVTIGPDKPKVNSGSARR